MTDPDVLANVFSDVLGCGRHNIDESLMDSGGTSLHAIRIAARLSGLLGVRVTAMAVIQNPSPQALAIALSQDGCFEEQVTATDMALPTRDKSAPDQQPGKDAEEWILPSPQRRIWALHERDPARLDHIIAVSMSFDHGYVTPDAASRAWNQLIGHHPVLRMRVVDGELLRGRGDGLVNELQVIDLSRLPENLANDLAVEEARLLRHQPIDLRTGPVMKGLLMTRKGEPTSLDLVIHHVACDGAALTLLLDELLETVAALSDGREVTPAPADLGYMEFAEWETRARKRWPGLLELCGTDLLPAPERLDLEAISAPSASGAATDVAVLKESTWRRRLQAAFESHGLSPLVIGLAAVGRTFQRSIGQNALYVAVPVANRPPGFEGVVGDFVNTSLVKLDLYDIDDDLKFLGDVAAQVARVYEGQDLPFEEIVALLRHSGVSSNDLHPRVAVTLYNIPSARGSYLDGGLTVVWSDIGERQSKYDIVVTIDVVDERISLTCGPHVFSEQAARAFLSRIDSAAEAILDQLVGPKE